jgi:hypothetical protein
VEQRTPPTRTCLTGARPARPGDRPRRRGTRHRPPSPRRRRGLAFPPGFLPLRVRPAPRGGTESNNNTKTSHVGHGQPTRDFPRGPSVAYFSNTFCYSLLLLQLGSRSPA